MSLKLDGQTDRQTMARPSCLSAPAVKPPEKSADAVIISGLCTIDVHEMIGKILRKYYTLMIITASADLSGAALQSNICPRKRSFVRRRVMRVRQGDLPFAPMLRRQ